MKVETPNTVTIYFLLRDSIKWPTFYLHSSNDGIIKINTSTTQIYKNYTFNTKYSSFSKNSKQNCKYFHDHCFIPIGYSNMANLKNKDQNCQKRKRNKMNEKIYDTMLKDKIIQELDNEILRVFMSQVSRKNFIVYLTTVCKSEFFKQKKLKQHIIISFQLAKWFYQSDWLSIQVFYKILMDIININVGQCGRRIGDALMHRIYDDHFSQPQPIGRHQTFFAENNKKHYARSIFVDMDTTQNAQTLQKSTSFYKQQNFLRHKQSSQSIYGVAKYGCGNIQSEVKQQIRKQFELSDGVSGLILTSSYSGGTGSGLTSNIYQILREKYPCKILQTFRLMPEFQLYVHPIQVYNTAFTLHHQVEFTDMSLIFDNGMLHKSLLETYNFTPTFQHLNSKISQVIADSTIPFRFKGQLNTSQRKIASNLNMFPRMHFFGFSRSTTNSINPLVSSLSSQNFLLTNFFKTTLERNQSSLLAVYAGVRSNLLSQRDISVTVKQEFLEKNMQFTGWIPDNIHISLHQSFRGKENVSIFVNSPHFHKYLRRISDQFTVSFRRKAFIHHYTQAGMDEMQFIQAESNINDLYSEYQQYWTCYDQDWWEEEEQQ